MIKKTYNNLTDIIMKQLFHPIAHRECKSHSLAKCELSPIKNQPWLIVLSLVLCCAIFAMKNPQKVCAQQIPGPPPPRRMPADLPMHSVLYELNQAVTRAELRSEQVVDLIRSKGLLARQDGRVNVEIINQKGKSALSAKIVNRFNGEVDATWRHRVSAWVPPDQLTRLARALPPGFYMEKANVPMLDDEGPSVTGSDAYRDAGADGSGIRVGIIDGGYFQLTNAVSAGNAPATYNTINFTSNSFESGTRTHGTSCVENVFDHAPGATYFIFKISNLTHFGNAVDSAVTNNIDILSHSISRYNTGWEDNSGDACAAALTAANNWILFFTSAGNRAQAHWKGNFSDSDSDDWHEWAGGDETLNMSMASGATATFYLSWNTSDDTYDYDFYLYDATFTNVLASSTNIDNNYEDFSYTNSTASMQTVYLAINRSSGGTTELEVFMHNGATWLEYIVSTSSTTSPSNTTHPNIISVGAVDQIDFTSAHATSGIIEDYSSLGPTNSGNQAPDISGPSNTTITGGGTFGGTSSATPNAAGVAAAFWSSIPSLSAPGVRFLLFEKAKIFKDWGSSGTDFTYGHGGIQLHTYHVNTVWVDKDADNIIGTPMLPYYTVEQAQNALSTPGRVVFLGDTYRENITLDKGNVDYESIGSVAIIGTNSAMLTTSLNLNKQSQTITTKLPESRTENIRK